MRKEPTEAEKKLWWHLRHRLPVTNTHFRRQVRLGRYIVDFANHGAKLAIEIKDACQLRLRQPVSNLRVIADGLAEVGTVLP